MKYMFVGLGSIGQRHLNNLRDITQNRVIAYRSNAEKLDEINKKYNIESYTDIDQAFDEKPDVVFITNPTSLHMPIALKAAENNCHIFVEKPISHNLNQTDELFSIMEKNKKICFVGFNYRFHPNLIKIKQLLDEGKIGKVLFARIQAGQYLPDWHPEEDYRQGSSAKKNLGGGVILTLIHEIDYAYWLFGKIESVMAYTEKLSSLDIDVEDTASMILKTKNNAIIELHIDYLQKPATRATEITGEKGTILWDYFKNEVKLFQNKENKWTTYKEKSFERNKMYDDELKHFLKCINNEEEPKITNNDIKEVMKIVEAVKKSAEEGKRIDL
jgi:predicted dehydrogenase